MDIHLTARMDLVTHLKAEAGPIYMVGAVYFPLEGSLADNTGKHALTFVRNSVAYSRDGVLVAANVPRWEAR